MKQQEFERAKKKTKKRLKRKREIQKRWCCHHNVQSCQSIHPYIEKKVIKKEQVIVKKKTWKENLLNLIKENMIGLWQKVYSKIQRKEQKR